MRKAIVAGLAVAVAAWAVAGEAPQATPIEQLVPSNAVALVQVTSFPKLRAAFEQSALAESIQASQMLSYFYRVAGAAADFGAVALSGRTAEEARGLIGGQMGLVLLDFKDRADIRARVPIALLVEATDPKKLEQVVTEQVQLLALFQPAIGLTTTEAGGTTIHEVSLPQGATLAYAVRGKLLILGSPHSVGELLAGGKAALAASALYKAVRQQLGAAAGVVAYVDVGRLIEKTGALANPAQMQGLRGVGLASVQAAGLALDFEGRQVRERLYLHTGGTQTGLLKLLTTGAPIDPALTRLVPPNYTVVATMALKDVGLWGRIHQLIVDTQGEAAAGNMDIGANMVQQQFGIQLREGFFDTLKDELFLAADLSKIPAFAGAGRQPRAEEIPFLVGAKLGDGVALTETLDRIAANEKLFEQGIERAAKKHGDTDVFAFRVPFRPDMRPSYAMVDDVLLFSLRPEAIQAALDARKAKKSFAGTAAAKALPGAAHLRLQVNDAQLLTMLLGMVRDGLPEGAQRLAPELERIFGGLHGYAAVLRREDKGVSLTAQSDLGTTGTFLVAAILLDQFNAIVAKRVSGDFDKIAAALEQYHAKHGSYPGSLDQLAPDFLETVPRDRFQPARPYGYSRGTPGLDGKLPDAWCLTSVGPDKKVDIPVEQFDPPDWQRRATAPLPEELEGLKRVVYQFRSEQFKDERKNDDEGDLIRMGGKALGGGGAARAPVPPAAAPKPEPRPKPPTAPPDF